YKSALETEEFWGGSSRRTLTFECAANAVGLDTLNTLLSTESSAESLELSNTESGTTNIYDGYVLKLELGIKSVLIAAESPGTPSKYEDRLIFKLGKRTYIEQQLRMLGIA
ncbi:MAG: hypothetical protein RR829_04355, partial [Oscillospiraceae bacterium]